MTLALVLLLSIALFAASARLVLGRLTDAGCGTCGEPLITLQHAGQHGLSYGVVGCGQCRTAHTVVHGGDSRAAYCPSCSHRSLEIALRQVHQPLVVLQEQDPTTMDWTIAVHAGCALCGHEHDHDIEVGAAQSVPPTATDALAPALPQTQAPLAKVLPFPSHAMAARQLKPGKPDPTVSLGSSPAADTIPAASQTGHISR